jgi:atypical dual specificity phosphatase
MPYGFSWVDAPHLAALAYPRDTADLQWLRANGIDILISLTEYLPSRHSINEAGLMSVHIPVVDMSAPSLEQMEQAVATITQAMRSGMKVAVHCAAGMGRTGTILAAHFVTKGMNAEQAIDFVRALRPGSIETSDQEQAVVDFAAVWTPPGKAE